MNNICACGKKITKADIGKRVIMQRDSNDKIIFHVCMHNVVITDERKISMAGFLAGAMISQEYKVIGI